MAGQLSTVRTAVHGKFDAAIPDSVPQFPRAIRPTLVSWRHIRIFTAVCLMWYLGVFTLLTRCVQNYLPFRRIPCQKLKAAFAVLRIKLQAELSRF